MFFLYWKYCIFFSNSRLISSLQVFFFLPCAHPWLRAMVKWRPVTNNSPCFKIFPLTRLATTSHGWPSNSRDPKPKPSTSGGRETRSSTSTQPSPTRTTRSVERSTSCSPWWTRPGAARWTAVSCWTTGPCLSRRPPSTSTTAVSNSRWSGTWTSTFTPMIIWPGSTRELSWTVHTPLVMSFYTEISQKYLVPLYSLLASLFICPSLNFRFYRHL